MTIKKAFVMIIQVIFPMTFIDMPLCEKISYSLVFHSMFYDMTLYYKYAEFVSLFHDNSEKNVIHLKLILNPDYLKHSPEGAADREDAEEALQSVSKAAKHFEEMIKRDVSDF